MAVYREGFVSLEYLKNKYKEQKNVLFVPFSQFEVKILSGDIAWQHVSRLIKWYGKESTKRIRKVYINGKVMNSVECVFSLIDEWAVSDGVKTIKAATETWKIEYMPIDIKSGIAKFYRIN